MPLVSAEKRASATEAKNTFIFPAGCAPTPAWYACSPLYFLRGSRCLEGSPPLITAALAAQPGTSVIGRLTIRSRVATNVTCTVRDERVVRESCRSARLAGAVAAAVLRAGTARVDEPLLQRLPRAEHAHAGIVRGQTALLGEGFDGCALDVDGFQRLGVLRLQGRCDASDAGADFRLHFRRRLGLSLQLTGEGLHCARGSALA